MTTQTRVLIVDDDIAVQNVLVRGLEQTGFQCTAAKDGRSGIEALRANDVDVALIDLRMPGMNGMTMLQAMADEGIDTVPVILSGHTEISNAVEATKHGAFDFLTKPLSIEIVRSTIDKAVRHRRLRRRAHEMTLLAEQWQATFDGWPDMVIILDNDLRVLRCNQAAVKRAGKSREKLVGHLCHDALCDDDHPAESCPLNRSLQNAPHRPVEFAQRSWNGHFELTTALLRHPAGDVWGSMHIIREISQRKILEAQLVQAQKLEAIGQLAAGIAHEVNTPTQYVGSNVHFLREGFDGLVCLLEKYTQLLTAVKTGDAPPDLTKEIETLSAQTDMDFLRQEIPRAAEEALDGIDRIAEIVKAMKQFSHPGTEAKSGIDINQAIENTILVARHEWKYVAETRTDLDPHMPLVPCLPGDFNQVILNLIVNAAHAIGDVVRDGPNGKGAIAVRTRRDGDWAEIRISDTGTGIPSHIRSRIFDPFFTTKEVGKGTGQGLAIAHNVVVEKHGGTITFETVPDKGTTFIIRLPLGAGHEEV